MTQRKTRYESSGDSESFIVPVLAAEIRRALELHGSPRGVPARALDVGCGGQPFRADVERLGYAYMSADLAPEPGVSLDFVWNIEETVPLESLEGKFELVLCTEVLEHVARWDAAFENLARVLAPGGRLLVTCPFVYGLHEEPQDYWRPTRHVLRHFAAEVGLRVVYERGAGDPWDVLGTVLAACSMQPLSTRARDRFVFQLVSRGQRWLYSLLVSGRLQRAARMQGPFYLANVFVFEK